MGRLQGHLLPGQPRDAWQGHAVLLEDLAGWQAGCGEPGELGLGRGRWWEPFPSVVRQAQKLACTLCTPMHTHLKPLPSCTGLSNQMGISACAGLAAGWQAVWSTQKGRGAHTYAQPWLAQPARDLDTALTHKHTRDARRRPEAPRHLSAARLEGSDFKTTSTMWLSGAAMASDHCAEHSPSPGRGPRDRSEWEPCRGVLDSSFLQ